MLTTTNCVSIIFYIFFYVSPKRDLDGCINRSGVVGKRRMRNKRSMIHKLLFLLCLSDLCVVVGLLALFSLPNIWPYFTYHWPHLAPWLIPIVQIALLTSVYTTVLISLERYVRIVYVCNLKVCWFFNEENFK